jgi:CheY-like chemotaxis protein
MELLKVYKRVLKRKGGCRVVDTAMNGEEAVLKLKNAGEEFDLVIMDHRMPVMDGLEATREIVKLNGNIKIIFMSADDGVRREALKAGAIGFLKKPISVAELLRNIDGALKKG